MLELQNSVLLCMEDQSLKMVLEECLEKQNIVSFSASGMDAIQETLDKKSVDCILVEASFDNKRGYSVVHDLRREGCLEPIVFLTDSTLRQDDIRAYELGADDVVHKPFSMDILICKINALARRYRRVNTPQEVVFHLGDKIFDSVQQTFDGKHMSGRENELLLMLCRQKNEPVDKHLILRSLWQKDDFFSTRSLAVYVNHLRGFLEGTDCRIVSVHGKGYKLIC